MVIKTTQGEEYTYWASFIYPQEASKRTLGMKPTDFRVLALKPGVHNPAVGFWWNLTQHKYQTLPLEVLISYSQDGAQECAVLR